MEMSMATCATARGDFLVTTLRRLVRVTAGVAGVGLLTMVVVTLWHMLHPGKPLIKP